MADENVVVVYNDYATLDRRRPGDENTQQRTTHYVSPLIAHL